MIGAVTPAVNVCSPPRTPWAPAWRSVGTTMPTATPVLETVKPSLTAWTIATANIAPAWAGSRTGP